MTEKSDPVAPALVVIVIYKSGAATDDIALLHGKEKLNLGVLEKKIPLLEKTGHAQQPESQVFIIQQRYVLGIIFIMVPVKIDKFPQHFPVTFCPVAKSDDVKGLCTHGFSLMLVHKPVQAARPK
jgi:hypothetical protein